MKLLDQIGHYKVVRQDRHQQNAPRGMRCGWTEYQVRDGRNVVSRQFTLIDAQETARIMLDAYWDKIGAELKNYRSA